jgi:predicted transposase YdaD
MQLIDKEELRKWREKTLDTAKESDKSAKLRIAKQMLESNSNISFIMQVTGLSEEEIMSCQ